MIDLEDVEAVSAITLSAVLSVVLVLFLLLVLTVILSGVLFYSPLQQHLLRFSSACSITSIDSSSWFALGSLCTWPLVCFP
jgi:small-conductance mechanosensitive channel